MTPDAAAAVLKAGALAALFQAAGGVWFIRGFGTHLGRSAPAVRLLVRMAAMGGMALLIAHECMEAARLAGEFGGIWDAALERLAWGSRDGIVHIVQVMGLGAIAGSLAFKARSGGILSAAGAAVAAAALAGAGHTSVHPLRAVLGPLLILHVSVGAFWFGSLGPLFIVIRREPAVTASRVLAAFSRVAGWLVPCLGAAGVVIAGVLIPGLSVFKRPYGALLAFKVVAFGLLLALAANNRWRAASAFAAGRNDASNALRRSIAAEIALITAVLGATAVLTTYFSPDE